MDSTAARRLMLHTMPSSPVSQQGSHRSSARPRMDAIECDQPSLWQCWADNDPTAHMFLRNAKAHMHDIEFLSHPTTCCHWSSRLFSLAQGH